MVDKDCNSLTIQPHRKVIILGAGLSGIVAGNALLDNGIDDFLVLEGQDYIGGRIKQRSFGGFKIEEGANWIQFAKDEDTEPIWKQKEAKQVKGVWTNYFNLIIRNEIGQDVTKSEDIQKFKQFFSSPDNNKHLNVNARDALRSSGWNPSTPAQWALDYLFTNYEMGRSPETVDARSLFFPESEYFISDQRGVMHLFQDLVQAIESKIKLNKKVEKIAYSSSQVEAMTSDGELFIADYAICTFSTGVLASNIVRFSPPLPKWKKEAILQCPMTVYTKIFLKFSEKFWDDEEFTLLASPKHKYFPVFQNLESPGMFPIGSGMLLITVTEDEGRRIENQTLEETKEEIVKMLRGVYGQDVPEPTDIFYPCWSNNPFICGAYSEPLPGRTEKQAEDLSKNLYHLYFSGEATSKWSGYMQGAYISGKEKAKIIAELILF